jgi:hypothetical protein
MKTFIIIAVIAIITLIIFVTPIIMAVNKTEEQKYTLILKENDFEIRFYPATTIATIKSNATSYKELANPGFRQLAGYIFGGNESKEQIAMTSPVTMELKDTSKMMFMVPKSMSKDDLPRPNNSSIYFEEYPERIVAAIHFGGWANDDKIAEYSKKLTEALMKEGITHSGEFAYLGYNPPFDVVNRRNEIIVAVSWEN